jgi:hypothetical protein
VTLRKEGITSDMTEKTIMANKVHRNNHAAAKHELLMS